MTSTVNSVLNRKHRCLDCWITSPRVLGARATLHLAATCPPAGIYYAPLPNQCFKPTLHCCRTGLVWENGTVTGGTSTSPVTRSSLFAGSIPFNIAFCLFSILFGVLKFLTIGSISSLAGADISPSKLCKGSSCSAWTSRPSSCQVIPSSVKHFIFFPVAE